MLDCAVLGVAVASQSGRGWYRLAAQEGGNFVEGRGSGVADVDDWGIIEVSASNGRD